MYCIIIIHAHAWVYYTVSATTVYTLCLPLQYGFTTLCLPLQYGFTTLCLPIQYGFTTLCLYMYMYND